MSALEAAVADYLTLRNGLGHDLADAARLLPRFAAWMEQAGQSTVTVEAALAWSQQPDAEPGSTVWSRRTAAVRGFARYLAGIDPATEVPPTGLLPCRQRWRPPFIYRPADIAALLDAARGLPSPLRAATYQTLFGLLAATGMRVGEAIRLNASDIDWDHGVVLVRESKFGKSRMVPLQPSTLTALRTYGERRAEFRPRPDNASFVVSPTGRRLIYFNRWRLISQPGEHRAQVAAHMPPPTRSAWPAGAAYRGNGTVCQCLHRAWRAAKSLGGLVNGKILI